MRIHGLTATAFGPFRDTVELDFEALNTAGLFLLAGPTGAGKTSLLDAVCFALFGEVPGDRQEARRLRSDHADPTVPPQVVLEVTASGRRFRITRSPEWLRPKRRGTGTTKEPARVCLDELVDGTWCNRSTRIDETAHLVTEVLGMSARQFNQVAMLPQGSFATFLRAGSHERMQLLESLFGTRRFRDMEQWLVERRKLEHRAHSAHERRATTLASQLLAVAQVDETESDDSAEDGPHHNNLPADPEQWAGWADRLLAEVNVTLKGRAAAVAEAEAELGRAREALDQAQDLHALRSRGKQAQAVLTRQAAEDEHATEGARALDAAERAREVAPLLEPLARAERRAEVTAGELAAARNTLAATGQAGLPEEPEAALVELDRAEVEIRRRLVRLEVLADDVERASDLDSRVSALADEVNTATRDVASAETALQTLPEAIRALEAHDRSLTDLAGRRTGAAAALERAKAVLRAVEQAGPAGMVQDRAEAEHRRSIDAHQEAVDTLHRITAQRLAGAAAALARELRDGEPCAVCGSAAHPDPAAPVDDLPSEVEEQDARKHAKECERVRVSAEKAAREAGLVLTRIQAAGGDADRAVAESGLAEAEAELAVATEAEEALAQIRGQLEESRQRAAGLADTLSWAQQRQTEAARAHAADRAELDALNARLTAELGADHDIARHVRSSHAELEAIGTARGAVRSAREAHETLAHLRVDAAGRAAEQGFADVDQVRAAALPAEERQRLQRALTARQHEAAAAADTLTEPDVAAALEAARPDLEELAREVATAETTARSGRDAWSALQARVDQLVGLRADLLAELDTWRPVRHRHNVAQGVSALAEGTSPDNTWRMSLSAYVLASRLEQVVAAANERLIAMTSGRFTLEHTPMRTGRDTRGGLGLLVRDEWTGHARDPKTLSGGETFQAALSLALGLAQVVAQESGGVEMQTLFVDEGFGALDAESLDDVMDVLDSLRSGGRVVGVVSHVPALRERITTQVVVAKHARGSTAQLAGA